MSLSSELLGRQLEKMPNTSCIEESINENPETSGSKWRICGAWVKSVLEKDRLILFILLGVFSGITIGIIINESVQNLQEPEKSLTLTLIGFPGELLMRMLKMLILPLIFCSLIVGSAGLGKQNYTRIGRRALIYYLSTTVIATLLGIVLVVAIEPGKRASLDDSKLRAQPSISALDSFLDLMRNMVPDNIVYACIQQVRTTRKSVQVGSANVTLNMTSLSADELNQLRNNHTLLTRMINKTTGENETYYTISKTVSISGPLENAGGSNTIGLVVISLAIGAVAGYLGSKAKVFLEIMNIFNSVIMQLIAAVMWIAPIGMCSLLIVSFAKMKDIYATFAGLALLVVTIVTGVLIQAFVTYPALYFIAVKKNPFTYMKGAAEAIITAFGTSSSVATLPVTIRCAENKNGVDKRISRFILPVGATINMDGSAVYLIVAVCFIAQLYNYHLSFGRYTAISIAAVLVSVGISGVPSYAPIGILINLQAAGLPLEAAWLIMAVDWILDRTVTACNVCGDCFGAGIVHHLSRKDLEDKANFSKLEEFTQDINESR